MAGHKAHCPTATMSLTDAHSQLKGFAAAWKAAGTTAPPLTVLTFDVSKAFDNVDVQAVQRLLLQLVRSPCWKLHKVHSTVWARGTFVTRYGTLRCFVRLCYARSAPKETCGSFLPHCAVILF